MTYNLLKGTLSDLIYTKSNIRSDGYIGIGIAGGIFANTGLFRTINNSGSILTQRNSPNSGDLTLLYTTTADLIVGSASAGSQGHTNVYLQGTSSANLAINGTSIVTAQSTGFIINDNNLALGSSPTYGGGSIVSFFKNASVNPSSNPTGGNILYVDSADGYFKYRKPSGTTITLSGSVANLSISGTGLVKAVSSTVQSTASLLVNADVDSAAAIDGTKISPNFGSQNITTTGILSVGTNPAATGVLRLPFNQTIWFRNSTNTGDVQGIGVGGSNQVEFGYNSTISVFWNGTTAALTINSSSATFGNPIAIGASPATVGTIRLPNNSSINARNAANTGDVGILTFDTSNNIIVGGSPNSIKLNVGGSTLVTVDSSLNSFTNAIALGTIPASAGSLRLPTTFSIYSRNNANNADIRIATTDSSDNVVFGNFSGSGSTYVDTPSGGSVINRVNSTAVLTVAGSLITAAQPIAIGTTPASAGQIRLPNNTAINFRNAANSADLNAIVNDSSNNLFIGSGSGAVNAHTNVYVQSSTTTNLAVGGAVIFIAGTTTVRSVNPIQYGAIGNNTASVGWHRYANNPNIVIAQRDPSNTFDHVGFSLNTTDGYLGSDTSKANNISNIHIAPSNSTNIYTGSTLQVSITSSLNSFTNAIAIGTTPAVSGQIRIPNAATITARNQANSGDIPLLVLNSSNNILLGDNTSGQGSIIIGVPTGSQIINQINGSNILQLTSSGATITGTLTGTNVVSNGVITIGANAAASGTIRLPNNSYLQHRNSGNTADIATIGVGSGNNIEIGLNSANQGDVVIATSSSNSTSIKNGTTIIAGFANTLTTLANPIALGSGTFATAGQLRLPNNPGIISAQRNSGNTANLTFLAANASELYVGCDSAGANASTNVRIYPTTAVLFGNNNTTVGQFDTTNGWFNNGYKITWNSNYATPKLMQDDLSTNSGTGSPLTIQAQNETGTTSTGGILNLTSGTGTSIHGALNLQIGGTSKFSIGADGYNTITSKAGIWIENGNSKFTDTNIKISATTTDATITNLYTWTIPTGISSVDAIVTAIKSDNSQGATYKRSITFRNNAGTVATIGTVTDNGTFEDNAAWDCTIDNSTTTGRIRVTGAAATNITWHLSSFRHEGIS